jgi:thymidylate synthase (FAD)
MRDEFYIPEPDQLRVQSSDNKQARGEEVLPTDRVDEIRAEMASDQQQLYAHYEAMLESGLAREIARANLPLSLYTEWYWQCDLHNLLRFLRLRLDTHAQYEIRVYAEAMATCAKAVAPIAYEAFEEHVMGAITFSRAEARQLSAMLDGKPHALEGKAAMEFERKLARMLETAPAEPTEEPLPA